jgi:sugar lactone lactonase YvrE
MHAAFEPCLRVSATLGEGLHWDASRGCLWMVDIHGRRVIRWQLDAPRWDEWPVPQLVGWASPYAQEPALLLGLQQGFARAELGDGLSFDWIARPFGDKHTMRLNDAKADRTGAVWAGSLNEADMSRSDGVLYRLAYDGTLTRHDSGYRVCNGPAISADGATMLHTDTLRRTIYAFDPDEAGGLLANKRVWKIFGEGEGYPDGMCFDADGCVWVAHWGAACISRFSPDATLLRRVALPVPQPTTVCFAGQGLDRLFVASARLGLSEAELAAHPLSGAVFEIAADGVVGLPSLPFGAPG